MPMKRKYYRKGKRTIKSQIKTEVKRAFNSSVERKERRYAYNSIGGNNGNDTSVLSAVSFNSISYGGSACVASLCAGIGTGSGEGNRIANQITLNSVNIHLNVQNADETNYVRLLLIRPKGNQDMSSIANFVTQIFTGTTSSGTQCGAPVDTNLFHIYYDKMVYLKSTPADGSTATSLVSNKLFSKYIKLNAKVQYDQTTTFPLKDFFLVGISDSASVSHPGAVNGFVKLTYQDA